MKHRHLGKFFFTLALGGLLASAATAAENTSRLHWLGQRQLGTEKNATNFMALWNLPASARLEAQTLAKLAGGTNAPGCALLADLLREEFYAEVRHEPGQPGAAVLAVRLNAERAKAWEANRAALPASTALERVGEWTLLTQPAGANALLAEWRGRIAKDGAPGKHGATNFWLEADVDLPAAARVLGWKLELPAGWPRIVLTVTGDGENVLTRGEMKFAAPLNLPLAAWNIPTNLIREPLISFTAVRGVSAAWAELPGWRELSLGRPPEQLYFWAQAAMPFQSYFAAAFPDALGRMKGFEERLLAGGNAWGATNHLGSFEKMPSAPGVVWKNAPFMVPFLRAVDGPGGGYLYGGLFNPLNLRTNAPPPASLLRQVTGPTDVVLYDWELTGPRMEGWLQTSQLFRVLFRQAQLPPGSAGLEWLRAVTLKLGNAVTVVSRTDDRRLAFTRKSTSGFTAVELHLLVDWLESPAFPAGLHTFRAQQARVPFIPKKTSAAPAPAK